MVLNRRDLGLAGIAGFIAWGLLVRWLPILRYLAYACALGALLTAALLLGVLLLTARGRDAGQGIPLRHRPMALITPDRWKDDVSSLRKGLEYQPSSLYPPSFVVSEGIDELLALVIRDFVSSWYRAISPSPVFANEIDRLIRTALGNVRDRMLAEDLISLIVSRIVPILTTHLKEFDIAERAVRGKNLSRNVTESEELDRAIASKYREGQLHRAATLSFSDQKAVEQEYLRKIAARLLPKLFPASAMNSRIVSVLTREIVACAVLFPVTSILSDPDTWNQLMEALGAAALQDRKTVRKLRAALDEHASPVPRAKHGVSFPRLAPHDSERAFERFVRAIRRCNNLSDARRFRAHIASQLKRESTVEGQDPVYLRRLETGKKVLDQKVAKLAAVGGSTRAKPAAMDVRRNNSITAPDTSLVDVLHNASGLSYFMEFMDRQGLMSLVQFWIVVDGFRNPLEDDFGDETSPSSTTWTTTDRNDMALISETYLSKPELGVTEESRRVVKEFLSAGKKATPAQYRKARTVILSTQTAIFEEMQAKYYPKFKRSDLYYKYLASDETSTSTAQPAAAPEMARSVTFDSLERRPRSPLANRTTSQPVSKSKNLRRAAVSSSDVRSMAMLLDEDEPGRRSFDSERSTPLFDDDNDTDPLVMSTQGIGKESQNGDELSQSKLIETMEAALNDIITDKPPDNHLEAKGADLFASTLPRTDNVSPSPRSSVDYVRGDPRGEERSKPSIASLGLIDGSSRRGVFDDDLFPDQQKFAEDDYEETEADEKDPADEVHEAAPGDLGLTEAIEALTVDIDKLVTQESVVDALTRKAELTNNTAELRILRKSKASIQREIHRKEMQRQQYIIQESDNSLYGRSTVRIKSIVVGKEEDGREYAMCRLPLRFGSLPQPGPG